MNTNKYMKAGKKENMYPLEFYAELKYMVGTMELLAYCHTHSRKMYCFATQSESTKSRAKMTISRILVQESFSILARAVVWK
jgi:hypothetical protein